MKLFTAHRNWWSTLSSTFIGSLLGIGITFAISDYIHTQHQTRMAKRMLVMTIDEINSVNKGMNSTIDYLMYVDSIYSAVESYYLRKIPMPVDSIDLFYETLNHIQLNEKVNLAQNIFTSNLEVMDIFEDLTIVKDITSIISSLRRQKTCYDNTQMIIRDLLDYNLKNRIQSKDDFLENFTNYQYDYYKTNHNFLLFHGYTLALSVMNNAMDETINKLQQKLGICNQDINHLKSSRLKKVEMSVSEKKSYDSEGNLTQDEQTIEKK